MSLRPDQQPHDPRRPFLHQRAAWARLDAHWQESRPADIFEGLLVMPTGAGKTYTAVTWLMKHILNDGGRILWVAHRDDLLEQAAVAFHRACGLAGRREKVNVRIVSGNHHKAVEVNLADDVVVASVTSLARHPWALASRLDDPRVFAVADEVHHAVAPTYRLIIDPLRARATRAVLGLIATPTRMAPRERPLLAELFGSRVL